MLNSIMSALEALTDDEVHGLVAAIMGVGMPNPVPGLMAWIDAACRWELHRRNGLDTELLPPSAAIPAEEQAFSIDAALALRSEFAKSSPHLRAFFDALAGLLIGAKRRQQRHTMPEG